MTRLSHPRVGSPHHKAMATTLYPETTTQFLARMIVATREGHQITNADAERLDNYARFGLHGETTPTMPEGRRDGSKLPSEARIELA